MKPESEGSEENSMVTDEAAPWAIDNTAVASPVSGSTPTSASPTVVPMSGETRVAVVDERVKSIVSGTPPAVTVNTLEVPSWVITSGPSVRSFITTVSARSSTEARSEQAINAPDASKTFVPDRIMNPLPGSSLRLHSGRSARGTSEHVDVKSQQSPFQSSLLKTHDFHLLDFRSAATSWSEWQNSFTSRSGVAPSASRFLFLPSAYAAPFQRNRRRFIPRIMVFPNSSARGNQSFTLFHSLSEYPSR